MKIIIVGAGKVGFNIAQLLSLEKHDVTVIEPDERRQGALFDHLDVSVVSGNGAAPHTLEQAGIKGADMLIAVTRADELNMISCLLAKQYGVRTTVARVRNPEYAEVSQFSPSSLLGIDLIINPERITALEIAKIIEAPEALNVEYYATGRIQLMELKLLEGQSVCGLNLRDLGPGPPFIIVSVTRGLHTEIPSGDYVLKPGDRIRVMAKTRDMNDVRMNLGFPPQPHVHSVVILGGGRTGYYLAHILEGKKIDAKIIERDHSRTIDITKKLKHVLVLEGDGTDVGLLQEENVGRSDLFVAVTDDDKINLLCSLIAKNLGAKKTVAKVGRSEVIPLVEQVGVDVVLSPRILTAGAILKFIRRSNIVSVTVLGENRAQMIELVAQPGAKLLGKKFKDIDFPSGSIVGAIQRGEEIFIPRGDNQIKENDHVIVFCLPRAVAKIERMFSAGV